jgi:hypothetical protein
MNLTEKLLLIQSELKAPKGQRNKFGNYNYRSAEDILEAIKPIAKKHNVLFKISDQIKEVGGVLFIESIAKVIDVDDPALQIETSAQAIIDFDAKGMQMPQRTGAASSYAKKYVLGNLLLIDDTKDADATNDHKGSVAKLTLRKDSIDYQKVKKFISEGGSIAKVTAKYSLSPEILNELKTLNK